jgi:RND family efflux transporter MFP subunit
MSQALVQNWLDTQCGSIPGIGGGLVMLFVPNNQGLSPAARWPQGAANDENLATAARAAFEQQRPVFGSQKSDSVADALPLTIVSHPLRSAGKTVGAVAVTVTPNSVNDGSTVLRSMLKGIALFDTLLERRDPTQPGALARVLELMGTALSHESFKDAATAVATQLATMLGCDRVSIGFINAKYMRVDALSQSADFQSNQTLLRDIAAAMDECADQSATIVFPQAATDRPRITQAHAALSRSGNDALCTIPLASNGAVFGALCLEYGKSTGLDPQKIAMFENIAALVGPVLELKRRNDLPLRKKIGSHIRVASRRMFGAEKIIARSVLGSTIIALAALAFIPTDYRLTAPARLEGVVQRVMVAPADGYLKQVFARPGDRVKKDQVLATLAEEDLKLEQRKWQSDVGQAESEYGNALAKQDRAQLVMAKSKIDEAHAQLSLVEEKLQRSQIRAPFDGVIIKGDLTQSLSAPVKRGEVLMTLTPQDEYRVIVEVDERDIADVKLGQTGYLALTALPNDTVPIQVARVTPVADTVEGRHYFEVEAKLSNRSEKMRPGLVGVAKLEVDQRSLLRIWTQRMTGWVRMTMWSWFG